MRVRVRNKPGNAPIVGKNKLNYDFKVIFRNYYQLLPIRPQMSKDYFFKSAKDLKNLKQGTNLSMYFYVFFLLKSNFISQYLN